MFIEWVPATIGLKEKQRILLIYLEMGPVRRLNMLSDISAN